MRMVGIAVLLGLTVALAACGSDETKTVTETVASEDAAETPVEATSGDVPTETTIPDGTWRRGVDYQPGLYRAPGGASCWWEQNQRAGGEAAGEGFNENYGSEEKNPLININAPFFKTEGCGTWVKAE